MRAHNSLLLAGVAAASLAAPASAAPAEPLAEAMRALALVLLLPAALASFVALEVVLWLLAPEPLAATCRAIARCRGRCLLVGAAAAAGVLAMLRALGARGQPAESLAALLLGLAALGALTGITAVASLLGETVVERATGRGGRQVAAVAVGAALLALACLFPIIGWVLFLYFLLVGLGGFLLAVVGGRGKPGMGRGGE